MSNPTLKKLHITSNLTPKILLAIAVAASLSATLSVQAIQTVAPSDIVFVLGQPVLTLTDTNPASAPEAVPVPITGLPAAPQIGVVLFYEDASLTTLSDGISFDGNTFSFISDADASLIPSELPVLARMAETGAPQDITAAFGLPGTGVLEVQSDIPDTGTTCSLLGLSLMGLAFLRRKLCFHPGASVT